MTYRLYYNREEDYPQIWSVDEGHVFSEVNVRGVQIHGCEARARNELDCVFKSADFDRKRRPIAWLEITARRPVLKHGILHFYPPRSSRK